LAGSYQWGEFDANDFVRQNELESHVYFIRGADDKMLSSLYAHAHSLVMISLYEGFGLPLVEAMQCGVPSIASNTSAVAEIAGDSGLLVDPLNDAEIAAALRRMGEDLPLREQLVGNAKGRARRFNWQQAASETMALIAGELAPRE
jgi:glycosyltransferase involved in cell wall biosynthesis